MRSTSKVNPDQGKRQLSYDEFRRKHNIEYKMGDDSGGAGSLARLMMSPVAPVSMPGWIVRLLKAAERENCPEAYGALLGFWLHRANLDPPSGYFSEAPGPPGRPQNEETARIYRIFESLGGKKKGQRLARAAYAVEFAKALKAKDKAAIKRLADKCAADVRRYEESLRRNH